VIFFRETSVVHGITYSFNYFFLLFVLFTQFIVDKLSKQLPTIQAATCSQEIGTGGILEICT